MVETVFEILGEVKETYVRACVRPCVQTKACKSMDYHITLHCHINALKILTKK